MINKFTIGSMAQFVIKNPFTTAAAVFTPIFAKNEDRGYFRTALITTPIVFATGSAVPKLFGGVRDLANAGVEARNLVQKAENWTRFEQVNFNNLQTLFKDPNINSNTIEKNLSAYLIAPRKSRDLLKEQKVLTKYFNRRFVKTEDLIGKANMGNLNALSRIQEIDTLQATKGKLISNALHVARRSSLTPGEWAGIEGSRPLSELSNEEMIQMFGQFKDRPEFVKTLRNRLREVGKLNYKGNLDVAPIGGLDVINSSLDFGFGDKAEEQLKRQAAGFYENLREAKGLGLVGNIKMQVEVAKDTSGKIISGEVGKVLNVTVTRRQGSNLKDLVIPIVDPATGQVRLGPNAVGVGNHVIGPDGESYRIDEWIAKQLKENSYLSNDALNEEITAHAYWQAGDPLDSRRVGELKSLESEAAILNSSSIKLRSRGAGVTKLPLFDLGQGRVGSFYDFEFGATNKVNFIRKLLNKNKFIPMGSEAGIYEGRFQLRSMANLSPFGAPSAEKQDPIWRSVTKEYRLSAPDGLPNEARPGWRSNAWQDLMGESNLPGARFNVASLNPQDRTLFSELPSTLEELQGQKGNVLKEFMGRGMSAQNAHYMYDDVLQIYKAGNQNILSDFGRMGETGFLMDQSFANNFQVEGNLKYNMDEIGVKTGDIVDPNDVLGFNAGDRVVPKYTGRVVDVAKTDSGFSATLRHELNLQGAKLDIAGIKGMIPVTPSNEHFQQMREIMNNFYSRTGSGDHIPENVNVFAPAEYFANKVDPAHAYLGMASDVLNRLQGQDKLEVAGGYLTKLEGMGVSFNQGQLVIDAAKNQIENNAAASERLMQFSRITEEFFVQAGDAMRKAGGYQDPVLNAFVHSGKDLGNWMLKNQLPAIGMTWDHSLANVPRYAKIGYDFESFMGMGRNFRGLKAIQSRLQTTSGGNTEQAREFLKYLMTGRNFSSSVPFSKDLVGVGSLNDAGIRSGSIFDPSIDKYKKNFSIDMGGGKLIPVPGTESYGAEANLYNPGEYQTRQWQHSLQEMILAKSPEQMLEAETKLRSSYINEFGQGKGSALRPYQYDPLGVPGFLSNAAEQEDPFVARVSEQWINRVHSKRLRKELLEGRDIVGVMQRQPTNELLYLKYRFDPAMNGTMDVAVPESISRAFMGDQDKDLVNNLLFDAKLKMENGKLIAGESANQLEREAAEEALEAMNNKQRAQLETWQAIKGDSEIANKASINWEMSSLASRNAKFSKAVANRTGIAVNRTAGDSIGAYSNVLTAMTEDMVRNTKLLQNPDALQRLKVGLFDIRQAPISARKAHVPFSLETAMQKVDMLRKGLSSENPETAFQKIHSTLLSMSETLSSGGKDSLEYKYWASQGAEDLKLWAFGRSEKSKLMTQVFTASEKRAPDLLKQAFSEGIDEVLGPIHGGRIAQESATKAGVLAEYLKMKGSSAARTATGRAGKIFTTHGKDIAIGLGVLAALGIVTTPATLPVATFSRSSSNKFRPEDSIGVSDSIPGEAIPGQMASSAPPRRLVSGQPGVRTTIVAPMQRTSDLTVKLKATDATRVAETSRLLAQIPGSGITNTTINYRDKTNIRGLRTREKIREISS